MTGDPSLKKTKADSLYKERATAVVTIKIEFLEHLIIETADLALVAVGRFTRQRIASREVILTTSYLDIRSEVIVVLIWATQDKITRLLGCLTSNSMMTL